jgi:DNA modification methylase
VRAIDTTCRARWSERGMEIDPKYVQVVIERWQNFTGRQAERVDG